MKKLLTLILAAGTMLALSCKKENQISGNDLFIAANIGSVSWLGQPNTSKAGGDSILVQGISSTSKNNLSFKIAFNGKGTYQLKKGDATFIYSVTPDSPASLYQLDTTQNNTVTVTQYDIVSNVTQGTFQMHFVKIQGSSDPGNTINLTNGRFWLQVPF